ncbi:MAG: UDP-3-O-(3-hydroxymyristoyl)glucosamine N-acyltransferase [Xanthomonadales bacterium]|nr:UDP-3-O-(3-hydroxymyristoyl)glucosamine N-acyltransferase [Xanthomonadales bacterium]
MQLQALAERFGLELRGTPDTEIDGVGTLSRATPTQVSFLANSAYLGELENTAAGAVVIEEKYADRCPVNALVAPDAYLSYARIARQFDPRPEAPGGIHETAVIDPTATIGIHVSIGPNVTIQERAVIGEGCTVHPGVVIGPDCTLGSGCTLFPNVTLMHGVHLGDRVILHPGCVIGADGFGIAFDKTADGGGQWEKVPQVGGVRIGNDCEIGANSAVDRGAIDDTVLEDDVRVDNLVQIGHNVHIGAHTAIAGCVGIAGSARIGRFCLLAGRASVSGHVTVADRTTVAADSNVMRDITEPGGTWNANLPAQPHRQWQRILARLLKLDALYRRIGDLEKASETGSPGRTRNNE